MSAQRAELMTEPDFITPLAIDYERSARVKRGGDIYRGLSLLPPSIAAKDDDGKPTTHLERQDTTIDIPSQWY